jgi:hypothetical protein
MREGGSVCPVCGSLRAPPKRRRSAATRPATVAISVTLDRINGKRGSTPRSAMPK